MNHLRIRPFEPSDVHELIPMWRASFEHGVGITDPHPIEEQTDYFYEEVLPKNRIRVALYDKHLVAFLASSSQSIAQLHVRVGYIGPGAMPPRAGWLHVSLPRQRSFREHWCNRRG